MFGAKKENKKKMRIPRDVAETIPYVSCYPNGIIKDYEGRYSKTYRLLDANFETEEEEKEESMILDFEKLLNRVSEGMIGQLSIINRTIDQDIIRNNIMIKPKNDNMNSLRTEWNDVYLESMAKGKNNISKDKLFTISTAADNINDADDILRRFDTDINKKIRKINKQDTKPLTIGERLSLLYDIYNCNGSFSFDKIAKEFEEDGTAKTFDLKKLAKRQFSTKDLIAPDGFNFSRKGFIMGDSTFCKAFCIDHLPPQLGTGFLNDISNLSCNMITSVTFEMMDMKIAKDLINNRLEGMNRQINNLESNAADSGVSNSGVISSELENARDEAKDLMDDVVKRDMKVFSTTIVVIIMARSAEELASQTAILTSTVSGHGCNLRSLTNQQEMTLSTALPLAQNHIYCNRILTTESLSVFIPFTVQDLNQPDGIWYGINPLSHNMIRYNRRKGSNYNGLVLGEAGSGKSFIVKEEISQRIFCTTDHIIIIDPEGEYVKFGKAHGATIIPISLNSNIHINPLDMDIQYSGNGENPIPMKCEAILTLIEAMTDEYAIGPIEKSVIYRVGKAVYNEYYNHMQELAPKGITCDYEAMPTLQDFYSLLTKQPEMEAQRLATEIEPYCVGNNDVFAERTNVNTDVRFIIYDISSMTPGLKEVAMHVCMNDSWNKMTSNGRNGIATDLYIDEFHMFTKSRTASAFMKDIYKRARKRHGSPTAITQNISDMYVNDEAEAIVKNCKFIVMMNQSPTDRAKLAQMYNISPNLLDYITDQLPGNGLIYNGTTIVPFENEFPENTELYKLMDTSRAGEDDQDQEQKK